MTAPTPPDRPTLSLSKTAKPASEDAAPANRSTPRYQAGGNKRQAGDTWDKPQRPVNVPRSNTFRVDAPAPVPVATPTHSEYRQAGKPGAGQARPFNQSRGPAGRNAPQNQMGSYSRQGGDNRGNPQRQDNAPRGNSNRFDAPAQRGGDYRQDRDRAPANRSMPPNQFGSFNRQGGDSRGNPQRQDNSPRGNSNRFDASPQRGGDYSQDRDRAPANRNTSPNQFGSFNRQGGVSRGNPQRQDNAPRGNSNRYDAPAQRGGDYGQERERAPASRNTPQNQYGSFNRQGGDSWGNSHRQDNAPRGGYNRFDAPAPSNDERRQPAQRPRQTPDTTEGVRLNKYLADKQWCSRREADQWIEQGWVTINGKPVEMGQRVQEGDHVHVSAVAHEHQAQLSTIILHKPVGYVSGQAEDGHEPALVLITEHNQWQQGGLNQRTAPRSLMGFAPAGRLDIDSTGILILTQDGRMARHIIGENSEIEKEYLVRVSYAAPDNQMISVDVESQFPADQLELLRHGLSLDGAALRPAQVEWQNPEQLRFVLREGKKRQIRRMCEQVGLHVTGLKRVRIGQLVLGMLPPGQWRYLGEHETI